MRIKIALTKGIPYNAKLVCVIGAEIGRPSGLVLAQDVTIQGVFGIDCWHWAWGLPPGRLRYPLNGYIKTTSASATYVNVYPNKATHIRHKNGR